jgi:hypothetical protein
VIEEVKQKIKDRPVYISLDIDVLDPAFAREPVPRKQEESPHVNFSKDYLSSVI